MPRKKQYSESEVIDKAVNAFWEHGYAATSIRHLESEMGINPFSIYSSFGSKKGVFIKALEQYKSQVKHIFLSDLLKSDGNINDIRKFLLAFVNSVKSGKTPNGCLMANTAMDMGSKDKEIKLQLKSFFKLLKEVFIDVLKKAKSKKQISKTANIEGYANFLVVCTEGLAVTAKVLEERDLNDFVEVTIKTLK